MRRDETESPSRKRFRIPASLDGVIVGVVIVALWEAVVRVDRLPAYLLPAPSAVARRLVTDASSLGLHAETTLIEVMLGFIMAIVISIPLAAALAQVRVVERALYPVLVASQTIPKVAIAPLLVVWFGFGLMPKVVIAFLICFFPIVVDSLVGFRSAPKEVALLARSMGAGRWQTFTRFQIPAALPHIFAGVKVASTLAIVGAIVGEFVAADRGLGYLLIVANGSLDVVLSFTVLVVLSVIGVILYAMVDIAERWALPWHVSQRVKNRGVP
jgi:NitT/TauT family transport system permease protein